MEELVTTAFFGFPAERLYNEIYAIGYNQFLAAVTKLRDTLVGEFPDRTEDVENRCTSLLNSYNKAFDQEWFAKFVPYCAKNMFIVPRCVPVYDTDLVTDVEDGVEEMRHKIMATEYLNGQLLARVEEMSKEVVRRQELLKRIREQRVDVLVKAKEAHEKLKEVLDNPEQS